MFWSILRVTSNRRRHEPRTSRAVPGRYSRPGQRVNYRLELHGGYSHAQTYAQELLTFSGLQPRIIHAELRMEAGARRSPGLVIRAAK